MAEKRREQRKAKREREKERKKEEEAKREEETEKQRFLKLSDREKVQFKFLFLVHNLFIDVNSRTRGNVQRQ